VRSALYLIARLLGDVNAVRRGPKAVGKRLARKAAHRGFSRALARLLR
jgi:hypothetical protein